MKITIHHHHRRHSNYHYQIQGVFSNQHRPFLINLVWFFIRIFPALAPSRCPSSTSILYRSLFHLIRNFIVHYKIVRILFSIEQIHLGQLHLTTTLFNIDKARNNWISIWTFSNAITTNSNRFHYFTGLLFIFIFFLKFCFAFGCRQHKILHLVCTELKNVVFSVQSMCMCIHIYFVVYMFRILTVQLLPFDRAAFVC